MFIGSINRHMRAVLRAAARDWRGLPVYVACSGNFTVERILARGGAGGGAGDGTGGDAGRSAAGDAAGGVWPIHSNDVSIYSCALGWHLAGQAVPYRLKDPQGPFAWLAEFLQPGLATVATLLLAGEMLKTAGENAYARRMREQYRRRWPALHAATVERVRKATANLAIASYTAGDCRAFLTGADRSGVCISFPPTYKGGYERLFRRLEALFDWPRPQYPLFAPEDLEAFSATVRSFRHWMLSSDQPQPALQAHHVATVQTSLLSKPVYMYADRGEARYAAARQALGRNPWAPRTDEVVEPIEVVRIDGKTLNAIRSVYLAQHIAVCDAPRSYAVLSAGKLVGCFAFALPRGPLPCDLYLLTDFAVRPTPHRRLSKLVLACAVSRPVRQDLEQWLCGRIRTLGTTAFTDRPVSMKYRGLFEVHSRSEGKVNYLGPAGRWSLKEGYQWWKSRHSRT